MAGLESATYIEDLVVTNPDGGVDKVSRGDDHLRLIKTVLKNQFPDLGAAPVTATAAELTGAAQAHVASVYTVDRLYVRNGAVSASSVRITADSMLVANSSGGAVRLTSVDVTASFAGGTGLNKLDTGTEAPLTWYYVYVIYDGTTVGSLLSLASTGPTALPSGYTYWCRVGAVYNDSGPDLQVFDQRGGMVNLEARIQVIADLSDTSTTIVDCSAAVPPIADAAILEMRVLSSVSGSSKLMMNCRSTGSGNLGTATVRNPGGVTSAVNAMAEIVLATPQTLWYRVLNGTDIARVWVVGWRY